MQRSELVAKLKEQEDTLQPAALILDPKTGNRGVAILLGENLGYTWQSGDLMVFWEDGDYTDISESYEVEFIQALFGVVEDANGDRPE